MVKALPFVRFHRLIKLLVEIRGKEAKDKLIEGAWIGFQMGAGGKMNYRQYLDNLGLSGEELKKADDTDALRGMGIKVKKVKKK